MRRTVYPQWRGGLDSKTDFLYNSYGLPTEQDDYAYASGGPGAVVRKTVVNYATLTNGIVGMPQAVSVKDSLNNVQSQTNYCYDEATPSGTAACSAAGSPSASSGTPQHISVSGSRGNLSTISYVTHGTTTIAKSYTYWDTGNILAATDVNAAHTTYTYGTGSCGNSFPTSVSEPLNLTRSIDLLP